MGRLVEMYWDCPYCKRKKILGKYRDCPSCGKPRGTDTKFYMDKDNVNYVDEEKAKTINKNPDWLCSFCGALNNDSKTECCSCGATRTASEKNYFEMRKAKELEEAEYKKTYGTNEDYSNDFDTNEDKEDEKYEDIANNNNEEFINSQNLNNSNIPKKNNKLKNITIVQNILNIIPKIWIPSLIVLCTFLFFSSFVPHEKNITVTGINWNREIRIDKEKTVEESDWSLPANARLIRTNTELHHYDKELDHYETKTRTEYKDVLVGYDTVVTGYRDLGNGYSEEITEERPIYKSEPYQVEYEEAVYKDVPIYATNYKI